MQPKFGSLKFSFRNFIFWGGKLICLKLEWLYLIQFLMECPEIWSIESHVLYLGIAQCSEHNIQFWHFYCVYGILPPKQPSQCSTTVDVVSAFVMCPTNSRMLCNNAPL